MYSGTSIFPDIELKVKDGKTSLKKIKVGDMFKDAGKIVQTLKLSVLDADPLKAGQTQPFQYGSFYLRQVRRHFNVPNVCSCKAQKPPSLWCSIKADQFF